MANIISINPASVSDGAGVRFTIFFSGCEHNCPGCHNPKSHDFRAGVAFDDRMQEAVIRQIHSSKMITGVTLSGGDPMFSARDVSDFVCKLRAAMPKISVWLYTGFTYESILTDPDRAQLLNLCDVVVDGPFLQGQLDVSLSFKGSKNQRIIDLNRTRVNGGKIVLWEESL